MTGYGLGHFLLLLPEWDQLLGTPLCGFMVPSFPIRHRPDAAPGRESSDLGQFAAGENLEAAPVASRTIFS